MSQKYAVVTGASSGIGGAIAIELSKAGYFVALVGRNQKRLEDIKSKVDASGEGSRIFTADLNTFEGINKLISEITSDTKQIHALINTAAIWHGENEVFAGRDFDSFPQSVVSDTMMVGIIAPTLLSHALITLMPPKSKIINISGEFHYGGKGWVPYFVSKRATEDLTLALSDDLKDKDIQVNCISPSEVSSPAYKKYFPQYLEDSIHPEEVAIFAAKICSPESDYITGKIFFMTKNQPITEKFHA